MNISLTSPRQCFFCGSFLLVMLVVVCCAVMAVPSSLVDSCWERADLLAVVCVLCFVTFPNVSWSTSELRARLRGWRCKTGLSPPVRYFTARSKAILLLWIFFFCLAFAMPLCVSVYMCLVVTCWERADFLAIICGV